MSVVFDHERNITSENAETTMKLVGVAGADEPAPLVVPFTELATFTIDEKLDELLACADLLDEAWLVSATEEF